jgi:FixJ family two-component response regulator
MAEGFRILFVDDEETFLCSTVALLCREDFECDGAPDVATALEMLALRPYNLVIADIKMPGNADLEFVRQLSRLSDMMNVILVTGHPSIASAIQSVELPVVAYLVKPFDFQELLAKVRSVVQRSNVQHMVRDELKRLQQYREGLLHIEADLKQRPRAGHSASLQALVGVTLRSIVEGLSDLHRLIDEAPNGAEVELKHWAPAIPTDMREALRDAVTTLERTRGAFKSKELGNLRKRLEGLLNT